MARLVGATGRVHAYEANPKVADELRGYLAKDQLSACAIVNPSALSDHSGETTFFVNDDISRSSLQQMNTAADEWHPIQVPVTTLDRELSSHPIRFIKLDLEGAEFPALRGAEKLLSGSAPVIVFENPRDHAAKKFNYDAAQFFSFFGDLGYELYTLFGQPFKAPDWHEKSVGWYFLAIHSEDALKKQLLDSLRTYTQGLAGSSVMHNQWPDVVNMVVRVSDNMDLFVHRE